MRALCAPPTRGRRATCTSTMHTSAIGSR
jgi:hypothetical protein